ncbi:MAG: 2,3-bisphosphoglycerate-independent phosphoglycerate mutase, partial [Candidatus Harrisonbacteria bacterium]|nr:2,3-bisphosphoglycerate-independent phosphoglycerate mutase [Candidatus Harrisonbacteria bacterium]
MAQKCALIVLDGWGIGRKDFSNPIHQAKLPTIEYLKKHYPYAALQASGIAVGLPWGEVGNSEVGHLSIGAGQVIYQHYPRITIAVRDRSFFRNEFLLQAAEHAKSNNGALNLIGLLSEGHVHASFEHLEALLDLAKEQRVLKVNLHLFADGKDSAPHSIELLHAKLQEVLRKKGVGTLASLSGRYYGLDRDGHWDRTEKAYRAMTAAEPTQGQID